MKRRGKETPRLPRTSNALARWRPAISRQMTNESFPRFANCARRNAEGFRRTGDFRRAAAIGRAHASAHPGRIYRPRELARSRETVARADRERQCFVDAALGTTGLRKNYLGASDRAADAVGICFLQCGFGGN